MTPLPDGPRATVKARRRFGTSSTRFPGACPFCRRHPELAEELHRLSEEIRGFSQDHPLVGGIQVALRMDRRRPLGCCPPHQPGRGDGRGPRPGIGVELRGPGGLSGGTRPGARRGLSGRTGRGDHPSLTSVTSSWPGAPTGRTGRRPPASPPGGGRHRPAGGGRNRAAHRSGNRGLRPGLRGGAARTWRAIWRAWPRPRRGFSRRTGGPRRSSPNGPAGGGSSPAADRRRLGCCAA